MLTLRSDRERFPPFGLFGGGPGRPSASWLTRNGLRKKLPNKGTWPLLHGDIFEHHQASGGGIGDPLEREPQRVLRDVQAGKVSLERAAAVYGVVLTPDGNGVDAAATAARRRELRARGAETAGSTGGRLAGAPGNHGAPATAAEGGDDP